MAINQSLPPSVEIRRNTTRNYANNLSFPEDIGPHGLLMIFRNYEYQATRGLLTEQRSTANIGSSILLPIPNSIQDSFSMRVQRFDQGTFGDLISTGAAGAAGSERGGENMIAGLHSALRDALPNGADVANAISGGQFSMDSIAGDLGRSANFLLRKGLDSFGPNVARNVDAGFGSTINPKAALSFEGVEMKKHSFDWVLAPRTPNESDRIREISNTIKRNVLPEYQNVGGIQRAMLRYPSTVDIYFLGIDPSYYLYFKTCMVEQFSMNYAPQGVSILKGGKPAVVNMSIQLAEMDIHTADDYKSDAEISAGAG